MNPDKRRGFSVKAGGAATDAEITELRQQVELLRLEHVSRHFGALRALDDVSFTMNRGELRAVIGQNGAGKTTFFNLITGFLPATAGQIWFEGENICRRTVVGRVARGIVRTFQITEIFPDLTVFESIRLAVEAGTGISRWPWLPPTARRARDERVTEMMDAVDLTGIRHLSYTASRARRAVGGSHGQRLIPVPTSTTNMLSNTVRSGKISVSEGTHNAASDAARDCPAANVLSLEPYLAGGDEKKPVMRLKKVVLPAPFCPMTARSSAAIHGERNVIEGTQRAEVAAEPPRRSSSHLLPQFP